MLRELARLRCQFARESFFADPERGGDLLEDLGGDMPGRLRPGEQGGPAIAATLGGIDLVWDQGGFS